MKDLAGKFCATCLGDEHLTVTSNDDDEILKVECGECHTESCLCPEPGCSGKMRQTSRYVFRCTVCHYFVNTNERTFGEMSSMQTHLFAE